MALTYQPTPRDYQDAKIQTNGIAEQGWELVSQGSGLSRKLCPKPLCAKVVTVRLPGGAVVGYTYTATGQVASVTDARGTTTHAYDARDCLQMVATPMK